MMPSLKMRAVMGVSAVFMLGACAAGKDYEPPVPSVNQSWIAPGNDSTVRSEKDFKLQENWWDNFQDDVLSALMKGALEKNNDLKTAEARIAEARANERAAFAARLPEINATGGATRQKLGASSLDLRDTTTQLGFSGTFDLDIAGGNRRRSEAAIANTEATISERENVRLSLLFEVAKNYIQLRTAQRQYDLTVQNLKFQQETLDITKGQREEGAISDLEVSRAMAQVKATEARLPQLETAIVAAINRLNILSGEKPGTLNALLSESRMLPDMPASIVVGMPLDTVMRRPDVRAAERRLAEAASLRNAAFAEFFPKITLEGFLGAQTSKIYGAGSPWSAAINGLLPLLNFGRIQAGVDAADAKQQQAYYNYQQTVLLALEEVENVLTAYLAEKDRKAMLGEVAAEQGRAADIAREQYKAGVATQLDLLVAERNKLDADNDLALSEASLTQNLVQLYRAIGYDTKSPDITPPAAGEAAQTDTSAVIDEQQAAQEKQAPQHMPALKDEARPTETDGTWLIF